MLKNKEISNFLVPENDFSMSGRDIPTSVSDITIWFNGILIPGYDRPIRDYYEPVSIVDYLIPGYDKPKRGESNPVYLYDVSVCLHDKPISSYYSMVSHYDISKIYFSKLVSKVF